MQARFFILPCFLAMSAGLGLAGDPEAWPGFRGTGNSHTAETGLPVEWSDTVNIRWRAALAGRGQSSPVGYGKHVYVTSIGGTKKEQLFIEAFDAESGAPVWKREFAATQTVEEVTDMISRGAPTPLADENGVYVFFESGDLFAMDTDGKQLWERRIVTEFGRFQGNHGIGTSLAGDPDCLILLIDHEGPSFLLCLDKKTGQTRWKTGRTSRVSWSTPLVTGQEIIVSSNGSVDGYDLKTGAQTWTFPGIEMNTVASPSVDGDMIVIGSSAPNGCLAIKAGGSGDISATHLLWRPSGVTASFGSPPIGREFVYFVNRAGVLQAVRRADGALAWQHRLPSSTWASPILAGDVIYCFCKDGTTAVLRPGGEGPAVLSLNRISLTEPDRIYGCAVLRKKFYLRTEKELICVASS